MKTKLGLKEYQVSNKLGIVFQLNQLLGSIFDLESTLTGRMHFHPHTFTGSDTTRGPKFILNQDLIFNRQTDRQSDMATL